MDPKAYGPIIGAYRQPGLINIGADGDFQLFSLLVELYANFPNTRTEQIISC